jgi:hypothetical protein
MCATIADVKGGIRDPQQKSTRPSLDVNHPSLYSIGICASLTMSSIIATALPLHTPNILKPPSLGLPTSPYGSVSLLHSSETFGLAWQDLVVTEPADGPVDDLPIGCGVRH